MKHVVVQGKFSPFAPSVSNVLSTERDIIQKEAIVVDIITNDTHPEYASDGYNIGAIKFRSISGDAYRPQENLNWALPAETNISDYPLLNEVVIVFVSLHRWYYHRRLNITTGISAHAVPGLQAEISATGKASDRQQSINDSRNGTPTVVTAPDTTQKLGKFFVAPDKVYRLRHDEGDLVFQGRSGQSIRMGAAWKTGTAFQSTNADQSPNLLLRVGQDPNATPSVNTPYGLVSEDVNKDSTSLYMTSDQIVPLAYSTKKAAVHQKSIMNFPKRLDGAQVVINSDRIVLNTKMGKIMGFALDGVHWTSSKDFTVDADQDYLSQITRNLNITIGGDAIYKIKGKMQSSAKSHALVAPKNYLGSVNNESQPIPAGAQLAAFLAELLHALSDNPHIVLMTADKGLPSNMHPTLLAKLQDMAARADKGAKAEFNSTNSFTVK
jgi:hypothetical protein